MTSCLLLTAISEERLAEAFDRIDADDSGYISAENLIAMLGDDFPKEEIKAIIKEADITKDGKISYAEFLALWEDKNEEKHRQEIQQIQEILESQNDSERSSVVSDPGDDDLDGTAFVSRANFLKGKRTSERKATAEMTEAEGDADIDEGSRHVGFKEEVKTIPTITYEDGEDPVMKDDSESMKLKKPVPVPVE